MNLKYSRVYLIIAFFIFLQTMYGYPAIMEKPLIFPFPLQLQRHDGVFTIDESTYVLLPQVAGKTDEFLANQLLNEFVDKYEQTIVVTKKPAFTYKEKFILMGDVTNPMIRKYCEQKGWLTSLQGLGEEGYILSVSSDNVVVAANGPGGALSGMESLRQIINQTDSGLYIPQMLVKDAPQYPFRGIKLYLPGRENVTFFKRFIKDFVAYFKFNKIILELNANMRLERHPELNLGTVQFERHLNFSRLDRPPGKHMEYQNSSHQDNADGGILEKEEVADLVSYVRKFNIEVIPELPSLTHAYYLLFGHRELAENPEQPWPDTYCPLKPESYMIYFDVLDEYIDVIHPSMIHVGHDEWRMEKDLCALCRGKDYGELYAGDLTKIHDYLAKKGIKTAIWGDHLLESVTEKEFQTWKSSIGYQYKIPGALRPDQVTRLIPKDILIFNWFWDDIQNDKTVSAFGFQQVYGNLRADIETWNERRTIKGLLGGAPSSWAGTTENNFGKDQILDFLGSSNLLWSKEYLPYDRLAFITDALISDINYKFSGKKLPSDMGSKVTPLDISSYFNSSLSERPDSLNNSALLNGMVRSGNKIFHLIPPSGQGKRGISVTTLKNQTKPEGVTGIKINNDPNSILFLHACAKESSNKKAYDMIYNFDETAELLGWYEVVYEDGYMEIIPVRYGLNILDWAWKQRISAFQKPKTKYSQNQYAYNASAVLCSKEDAEPLTFFAYEWVNPRRGKEIREINLKPVKFGKNNENAIILLGVSLVENSKQAGSKGNEKQ